MRAHRREPSVPLAEAGGRARVPGLGVVSLAETGIIVFCAPAWVARRYPRPGISYQPVSDLPDVTLAVAWPQDARSPAVAVFVRAVCAVAAVQTDPISQGFPSGHPAGDRC
ncbi:hypothetical protein ACGFY6_19825 [Streptomyces sp. NPDC048387]|uniref:hypothetical protein n=1 Tax=Streptomyces sp. NPDC048387 TaxID=3365542 RepID=UPI003714CC5E